MVNVVNFIDDSLTLRVLENTFEMISAKRPPPGNKPPSLLSLEEKGNLLRLIGSECMSMASAVVQVFLSEQGKYSQKALWNKHHCGVLCFVKDNVKKSYFFRVYCMDRLALLWEQELYSTFKYRAPKSYFHTF